VRDDRSPSPPATVERFFIRMQAGCFDLAVQLQARAATPTCSCAGSGRVTAGYQVADAPPLDRTVPYTGHQPENHRFLEVTGLVGATPVTPEPRLEVTEADRAEEAPALAEDDRPGGPAPGSERFAAALAGRWLAVVGSELVRKGAWLAVVGTASERGLSTGCSTGSMVTRPPWPVGSALGVWPGCWSRPPSLVGNDSGPRRLAAAVGTAIVAIHWVSALAPMGRSALAPMGRSTRPGTRPQPL
jgi:hypothetical protein